MSEDLLVYDSDDSNDDWEVLQPASVDKNPGVDDDGWLDLSDIDISATDSDCSVDEDEKEKCQAQSSSKGTDVLQWSQNIHSVTKKAFCGPTPGPSQVMHANRREIDFFCCFFPPSLFAVSVK